VIVESEEIQIELMNTADSVLNNIEQQLNDMLRNATDGK